MPEILVEGLSKSWGGTAAVDAVDFRVPDGSFTVLLGPSGCGKSTTLRLIAGLDTASGGRVSIDGRDVTHLPPPRRALSMVFQNYALFPHLNVAENILFGLKVRRVPAAERRRRLEEAAALLGLAPYLDRKPGQLSGGQQQRVALGRAIVAQSGVCLMDEPLSNLDAKLRNEMRREIRELQQRLAMTMIYVTHDQAEAMSMADQVIVMNGGRIEQAAAPAELYTRPATRFVAGFIGTPPMNLLELADGPDGPAIRDVAVGRQASGLLLGIRPECIALGKGEGVPATVEASEYLGADTILACRIGGQPVTVRAPGALELAAGAPVRLRWPAGAEHVFDAKTGLRRDDAGAGARVTGESTIHAQAT
ncbi:ABC transporter ATP-binding protein [Geminicoccaceae bacterium 1502E]|nr:ABC transporter ATP-binding protein [Geminicoccaceae bacterium 1502E]